ncbi:hypothetical protein ACFQY0_20965 [Haloferula chungangensis]|uniref:Uncharacterized protein n=1 Tax=Haloferula chungangensis TaxID=1048331 RepID=A0ABW2LCX6_9BACT
MRDGIAISQTFGRKNDMRQFLLCLLVLNAQIVGAFAEDAKLLHPLSTSPDGRFSIAIRYPKEAPPTVFDRGDDTDVRMEEGSEVVATTKDGKVISSLAAPQGYLWVTWNDTSDYVAIRWHVYRTHGGCELYRLERKESATTFSDVKLTKEPFLKVLEKDREFSSDLKWIIRPFEWRGSLLRVECIPLSKGDEPHPFAQDRIWYEVDALIARESEFVPVALHATHGNYRGNGELIRPNPVWRNYQAEQGGAGQPATRSELDSVGGDKPQLEAEGRPR